MDSDETNVPFNNNSNNNINNFNQMFSTNNPLTTSNNNNINNTNMNQMHIDNNHNSNSINFNEIDTTLFVQTPTIQHIYGQQAAEASTFAAHQQNASSVFTPMPMQTLTSPEIDKMVKQLLNQ